MDLAGFRALLEPEGRDLLAELPAYDAADPLALAARLRRGHPAELVAAALTQSRLRARARGKFDELAGRLYFTPAGLEQATRAPVAARHAARLRQAGVRRVADLGCGIGGDALAFAAAGLAVLAIDRDPLACAVTVANAAALGLGDRIEVRCADLSGLDVPAGLPGCDAAWCDPSRRDERGRRFDPESWSPPYSWLLELARRLPATGAKLAPGIPHALLPDAAEAEWVSDAGEVKEAALWWGPLSSGAARRATLLPAGASLTGTGDHRRPVGRVGRYLYEPDGAVIRAGLVGELAGTLGARLVDASIAYLTADAHLPTPLAAAYEVSEVLPFSVKRLRSLVRERGIGRIEVKKRGSAVEPEQLRRALRPAGPGSVTIVLTRVAGAPSALIAAPLP